MATDKFLIAPINSGLQTDVKPFMIPDDAFAQLNNAYVYRGRVRKRFGSYLINQTAPIEQQQLFSRLRVNVGTTDGAGNLGATIVPDHIGKIGQVFSVGTQVFSVFQAAGAMLSTGAGTGTYNTATRTVTIAGAAALTIVYFYPAEPVMGLITYETDNLIDEKIIAFDTQFAYDYTTGGGWQRISAEAVAGDSIWNGTDSDFFWGANWRGIDSDDNLLFVTNYNTSTPDYIRYYDGTQWATFNQNINTAGDRIVTARIIVPFKGRLVLLSTQETIGGINQTFDNRARWSQVGAPIGDVQAWYEYPSASGRGGFADAATREAIISAQFIKDRLIVFFETSTWELVFTNNQVAPFIWQQINVELGAEATFSTVSFDKYILTVGNVGIHACNGANVDRIDQKIPEAIFEIRNRNNGIRRVNGIRDYFVEQVYWTFPATEDLSGSSNSVFPNRVLVFNYVTGAWAFNDDSITCFGYYQNQEDVTWAMLQEQWQENTDAWSSGVLQSGFRNVLAGNQQGFTFVISPDDAENARALYITDIAIAGDQITLTIIDHNMAEGDFILLEDILGTNGLNDLIFEVDAVTDDTITIIADGVSGTYTGRGTVTRVSQIDILTKQYNFYLKNNRNMYVQKVDFLVDRTASGAITVDYFTSYSNFGLVQPSSSIGTGALLGSAVLETSPYALIPFEQQQQQLWHTLYTQAEGEAVQLRIYLTEEQMVTPDAEGDYPALEPFVMNAMLFTVVPTSRLQ